MPMPIARSTDLFICTFGTAPLMPIIVDPKHVIGGPMPVLMTDLKFMPGAVCLATPPVPTPCTPALVAPWQPVTAKLMINGTPCATLGSVSTCGKGGTVMITVIPAPIIKMNVS